MQKKKEKKKEAPPPLFNWQICKVLNPWALFPETNIIAQHLVSKTFPGGTLSSQPINHDHYENSIKHRMLPPRWPVV